MAEDMIYRASTTAPVNIAVIKYWGKRDPHLNLPTNSSLSVTLAQSDLRTHTTASCSPTYPASGGDTLLLNSLPQSLTTPRSQACLSALRSLRRSIEHANPSLPPLSTYPLHIISTNNFPTAAGLASSAAGFAALIRAIADLYALPQSPEDLSLIARQGSGSACRSLLGGYVAWDAGALPDGSDSKARLVAAKSHWPEMRAMILVASATKKDVSSTSGMQHTVATSALFRTRAEVVVPREMGAMERAIQNHDFETFGRTAMRESNSFHACCLDTEPPIRYLNDVSWAAMQVVRAINERMGRVVAAYTFDAGPNCVVYFLEEERANVVGCLGGCLGERMVEKVDGGLELGEGYDGAKEVLRKGVSRVIMTGVGEGPVSVEEHLIDEKGEAVKEVGVGK